VNQIACAGNHCNAPAIPDGKGYCKASQNLN
jgi:hypothetical protein